MPVSQGKRGFVYQPLPLDNDFRNEFQPRLMKTTLALASAGMLDLSVLKKAFTSSIKMTYSTPIVNKDFENAFNSVIVDKDFKR